MPRSNNRIEGLGRLVLQTHEELFKQGKVSLKRLIANAPSGSVEQTASEALLNRMEERGTACFRTVLVLEFDNPADYLRMFTHMGWATLDCDLSVLADGSWKAEHQFPKDEYDTSVQTALVVCDGDPIAAFALVLEEQRIDFTAESLNGLSRWLACTPIGLLLSRAAQSLEFYSDSTASIDVRGSHELEPEKFCQAIAQGKACLELHFLIKELRDPTRFVNALARKMSKWWKQINADLAAHS